MRGGGDQRSSRLFAIKIEGHKDDPESHLLGRHKRWDLNMEGLAMRLEKWDCSYYPYFTGKTKK